MLLGLAVLTKWELRSHTRGVLHSLLPSCCGRVDHFAARGSRASPAPDAWLRPHQNVGSHDFCRCAHGPRVEEKGNSQRTYTCAESDHRILPDVKCENRSRTTCSRFHRMHSESNLACGRDCAARSSRAAHSPLTTRSQKKKKRIR